MSLAKRPIKRREQMPARRLEALRAEAAAARNIRHGTNISGIQSGAGASSISKDTITELVEIRQVMPVDEWDDDKPIPFAIGSLTKMTDAATGMVTYYRCKFAHFSALNREPGTLDGAASWTLVHTPYQVYILDAQSGAQTHEYQPVFIDDGGVPFPQFTRAYLGTGASGDKFMLLHRRLPGQWYWFWTPAFPDAINTTLGLFPLGCAGLTVYYPEMPPGIITKVRAAVPHALAAVGITGGQIDIYARTALQADTRDDGEVDAWTNSASLVALDATHNTNRNIALQADGLAMIMPDGGAVGCYAVTDGAFSHDVVTNFPVMVGLYIEER